MATVTSEDTRTRVLHAAGPIFAERGFNGATVRDICQAAGVNLASVNYHFRDKQRLYVETVLLATQMRSQEVPFPQWSPGTPPAVRLRDYLRTLIHRMVLMGDAPWPVRLITREVLHPTAACQDLIQEYFRPTFQILLGILGEMLPPETPDDVRMKIGFSIVGQCLFYRFCEGPLALMVSEDELARHFHEEQLADHITRFSLAALGQVASLATSK